MSIDGTEEVFHHAENIVLSPDEAVEPSIELVALPRRPGAIRRLLRRPGPAVALVHLALLGLAALLAPLIAPYDPNETDLLGRLAAPSWSHPLGTDDLGRDLLSRLLYGARVSLVVSVSVVVIAMFFSLVLGLVSGYAGGMTDNIVMRVTDAGLSFPALILAIAVAGILGPGIRNVILALSIVFVFGLTRLVRGTTLAVREEPFIEASVASGSRTHRIIARRVFPNIRSPLVIAATFGIAATLVTEAGLAFIGLGPRPPTASWGGMLRQAYDRVLHEAPWQLLVSGLAIATTIFAFMVVGEGLRDALGVGRVARATRTERRGLTAVDRTGSAGMPLHSASVAAASETALLRIDGLAVEFRTDNGLTRVVDDVSLQIRQGEMVGLVGESGSGKTVTALSIMRLVPSPPGRIAAGSIMFDGRDLLSCDLRQMREVRGSRIGMIFQDPMTSLDPTYTVGALLREALQIHGGVPREAVRSRSIELLELVGVPAPQSRLRQYPHQLSGGLRQRVMIAIALANEPQLLIADEPTTALDVTIQAQILDLLRSLQRELGMAVLFVTHDLGVIADLCDRVVVMYAGQIVEQASVYDLFESPHHPYTEGLLNAMPQVGRADVPLTVIPGQVPLPHEMPGGCRFGARCAYAVAACHADPVALTTAAGAAQVRCRRADELVLRGTG